MLIATIDAIVVARREPTRAHPQHLCLDKGYDNLTGHTSTAAFGYVSHIRQIGEEKLVTYRRKRFPARRWEIGLDQRTPMAS